MARPQQFSQADALAAAMDCFWRKGYSETSMSDLLEVMGISRSSFYNSFGDKESVFRLSLRLYANSLHRVIESTLGNADIPAPERIRNFLSITLLGVRSEQRAKGCLLVNTLTESASVAPEFQMMARELIEPVRGNLVSALNDSLGDQQARDIGDWLFTLILGWRVRSQSGMAEEQLQTQIRQTLSLLNSYYGDSNHVA